MNGTSVADYRDDRDASGFIDLQTLLWGNRALVEDDILLSCIFGGVMIVFGLGLIFRSKASSGGSDIVAMIISKYTKLPLGQLLIYVDSVKRPVGFSGDDADCRWRSVRLCVRIQH